MDKTFIDIDELAKRIEKRIQELEEANAVTSHEEYQNTVLEQNMVDLTKLIEDIDRRILELEREEEMEREKFNIDLDELTEKINSKLDELEDEDDGNEDLDRTLYDLNEISKIINETVKKLERQREKKRKKAMYCDLARKKERENKRKNAKKKKD